MLTDIGTEELGHLEMVGTIVHQLTRNLTEQQIKDAGFEAYFVDHTTGVFPQFASGYPWPPSRRPASPMTTSSVSPTIRTSPTPSASCGQGRSSTSSASARGCGW